MIPVYTCIEKQRDRNGKITGYMIESTGPDKDRRGIEPINLKNMIYNKRIIIDNLTLTSDGRLIDGGKSNDIMGREHVGDAQSAAEKLESALKAFNIDADSALLKNNSTEQTESGVIYTTIIHLYVNHATNTVEGLKSTKGTAIDISEAAKNNLNGLYDLAIAINVILKRGANSNTDEFSLRDYRLVIGTFDPNGSVFTQLTNKPFFVNLDKWLNHQLDRIEAGKYNMMGGKANNDNVDALRHRSINGDMQVLAEKIIEALGVNSKQLPLGRRLGTGIGNAAGKIFESNIEQTSAKIVAQTRENENFNKGVLDSHVDMIVKNQAEAEQAAKDLGINQRVQQKGLFGAFKR